MAQTLVNFRIDPFYNENNMKALDDSIEQIRQRKTVSFTMDELEAMEDMPADQARSFVDQRKTQRASL